MKMKIYLVEMNCDKWNDDIEFIIVRAKTRIQAKKLIYASDIFWNDIKYQKILSIRILGYSLKNKKEKIIRYANMSDA